MSKFKRNDGSARQFGTFNTSDSRSEIYNYSAVTDIFDKPVIDPEPEPEEPIEVTPLAPTLTEPACDFEAEVVIPEVTGLTYAQSREEDVVTVTATADEGYVIVEGATASWTLTIPAIVACEIPEGTEPEGEPEGAAARGVAEEPPAEDESEVIEEFTPIGRTVTAVNNYLETASEEERARVLALEAASANPRTGILSGPYGS